MTRSRPRRHQPFGHFQVERIVDVERFLARHDEAARVGSVQRVPLRHDAGPHGDHGGTVAREEQRLVLPPRVARGALGSSGTSDRPASCISDDGVN